MEVFPGEEADSPAESGPPKTAYLQESSEAYYVQ